MMIIVENKISSNKNASYKTETQASKSGRAQEVAAEAAVEQ